MKRVYSGIGGQAVIEGIMMKNKQDYAVAVRKADGEIVVDKKTYVTIQEKHKILSLPFIRGIFSFIDSMVMGLKTLTYSASFFDEEEITKEETDRLMVVSVIIAIIAAIGLFMLLPMFLSNLLKKVINNEFVIALIEGLIRITIFIIYIKVISRMNDIKRTFMYHGAEHKCINCVELGNDLTVENVMKASKEHKRCGTSFIIIVMIISILFFMVIRIDNLALRALSRIVLVPVIAGVSYEFLRLAGRSENPIINILSRPGMWMQGLTTKEPTEDMVEVAIRATEEVFDWKAFLTENFGKEYPQEPEATAAEAETTAAEPETTAAEPETVAAETETVELQTTATEAENRIIETKEE